MIDFELINYQNQEADDVPNFNEFYDPRLVAVYDAVNPIAEYETFYVGLAAELSASAIIDIGCGTGLLTCELAKRGHRLIGVEPSKAMLDVARRRACGKRVEWIEGDALSLGALGVDLAIMTGHVAQFFLDDEGWHSASSPSSRRCARAIISLSRVAIISSNRGATKRSRTTSTGCRGRLAEGSTIPWRDGSNGGPRSWRPRMIGCAPRFTIFSHTPVKSWCRATS